MKNKKRVITISRSFVSCNILHCEVGTTGHCGGDTGNGGRTYFSLTDESSTDMRIRVTRPPYDSFTEMEDGWQGIMGGRLEIAFGGDSELDTFIEALEFAAAQLKLQRDASLNIGVSEIE